MLAGKQRTIPVILSVIHINETAFGKTQHLAPGNANVIYLFALRNYVNKLVGLIRKMYATDIEIYNDDLTDLVIVIEHQHTLRQILPRQELKF